MTGDVGIEWVKKYNGRNVPGWGVLSNLTKTQSQAEGFYNTVDCAKRFNFGDMLAWDIDFQEPGLDNFIVDNVDIVFFSGHGVPTGPFFGVTGQDDGQVQPSEVKWGNKDLDWIAFDACLVLKRDGNCPQEVSYPDVFSRWGPAFQGLHYMLGFDTRTHDEDKRGKYFAQYLNKGWRVRDAWIKSCQLTEPSYIDYPYGSRCPTTWGPSMWAYLRAEKSGTKTYNDHLWGHGYVSPDPDPPGIILIYARGQN